MKGERDELVKRVFPVLRRLCESRGVTWGEVDLRWGITDEQTAEGQVLPICFEEIRECRPYFLGLLGERYGWVPETIDPALVAQEPWLSEYQGRSVTELEILHGALNDRAMADHAFFYFRDPAYAQHHAECLDVPDLHELSHVGSAHAEGRARERQEKLAALKARIRESGLPVREGYPDPASLGEAVLADLTGVIEQLFPAGSEPGPLERETVLHEAFARSRSEAYVPRGADFAHLDTHAAGDGLPLVVVGASGIGKSALLGTWARSWRERREQSRRHVTGKRDVSLVLHFVGASPGSADWAGMLRRILGELDAYFELGLEIPGEPAALRAAFADGLRRAATRGRLVLVIDALNQLEDRDGAPDLVWLPQEIPLNVRLILSTLPGRALDELRRRGWEVFQVTPLDAAGREQLISRYLYGQYRKTISDDALRRIVQAPQTANPLFLVVLLEELRLFGEHETLRERLSDLLAAADPAALYALILERWEEDYERGRPNLVRDAMTLLWAARRGLSESELLELLGVSGEPMPHGLWAPLPLAARQALSNRGALIGYAHDYARAAVRHRYLPTQNDQRLAHQRLAGYFARQDRTSSRPLEELPWQLARAEAWSDMRDLLATPRFTTALYKTAPFELRGYWSQLEASSPYRMVDAYQPVVNDPGDHDDDVWAIALVLLASGHPAQALSLWQHTAQRSRKLKNPDQLQTSLGNQAPILLARGDVDGAFALMKEQERICRELGDRGGLQRSLGNQAVILKGRGDLDGALTLMDEQQRICREVGDTDSLQVSLGNRATILQAQGQLDGALALLRERQRICRELGNPDGLQASLGGQATILQTRGDNTGALALHDEEERICRELGDPDGLQRSLGNQALIRRAWGDFDGALSLMKEQERICRELGNPDGLRLSLGNQALILDARGDLDGALSLVKEQERICRELGDPDGLEGSLGNQALMLRARGDLDGALALMKEQERICRELNKPDGLQRSLGGQALILRDCGDLDGALALMKEQERICRELGNPDGLRGSLGNQALILRARGDLHGAFAMHKEEERICRELGNLDGLGAALGHQALVLHARGDLDGALALMKEEERICRQLGSLDGLQGSLGNQAVILHARDDLDGALTLMREQERICRDLGGPEALAISLINQASLSLEAGRTAAADTLAREAAKVVRELGPTPLAQDIEQTAESVCAQANTGARSGTSRDENGLAGRRRWGRRRRSD